MQKTQTSFGRMLWKNWMSSKRNMARYVPFSTWLIAGLMLANDQWSAQILHFVG